MIVPQQTNAGAMQLAQNLFGAAPGLGDRAMRYYLSALGERDRRRRELYANLDFLRQRQELKKAQERGDPWGAGIGGAVGAIGAAALAPVTGNASLLAMPAFAGAGMQLGGMFDRQASPMVQTAAGGLQNLQGTISDLIQVNPWYQGPGASPAAGASDYGILGGTPGQLR